MAWSKYSDDFMDHPSVVRLLEHDDLTLAFAALGVYQAGLGPIAKMSTQGDRSGFIGRRQLTGILRDDPTPFAELLVRYGLWEDAENGWRYVLVDQHIPPQRNSETQRANGRKGAEARWKSRAQDGKSPSKSPSENSQVAIESMASGHNSGGESPKSGHENDGEKMARATGTGTGSKGSTTSTVTNRKPARTTSGQQPKQEALIEGGEPKPSTPAARARTLTQRYVELVPLSNFAAVQGIVRKAISANYDDAKISSGLSALAAEGRPVTTDALRVQMEGLPANGRARGHRPYQNPPTSAYTER